LELEGTITKEKLHDSLELIPFYSDESLYSYYLRLCEIDEKFGYLWIAMVFSGFSLGALKEQVDDLMRWEGPIPIHLSGANKTRESHVYAPKVYLAQKQLIDTLIDTGVQVYIVTAALEALSRMIASDAKYGINIPEENIIGVNLASKNPFSGRLTSARREVTDNRFKSDETAREQYNSSIVFPFVYAPISISTGKECAIKEYIHPVKKPIFVAGNSRDDLSMLFYCNVSERGQRLFIARDLEQQESINLEIREMVKKQQEINAVVDADQGWFFAKPDEIK
jgi:phosphorylcholine phosphatase